MAFASLFGIKRGYRSGDVVIATLGARIGGALWPLRSSPPLLRNGACRVYRIIVHMARIPDTCQEWAEGGQYPV